MNVILALWLLAEAVYAEEAHFQVDSLHSEWRFDRNTSDRSLLALEATGCDDRNWQCHGWAQLGYCATNAGYMKRMCRKSCNVCGGGGGGGRPCKGLNQPCWVNAQCCSARCHPNTFHCRPVGGR
eukprot:Skav225740  [mRNA]  locus=scaffold28:51220:52999:- [translate_table: standard]